MPQSEVAPLLNRYQVLQNQLLKGITSSLSLVMTSRQFPDDSLGPALLATTPLLRAGQVRTGALTDAYVLAQIRRMVDAGVSPAGVDMTDILITEDTPWLLSPVKRWRRHLAEGEAADAAKKRATDYLIELMEDEFRATEMAAMDQVVPYYENATGVTVRWQRVPEWGACGFCLLVADKLYTDSARLRDSRWHTYCRCGWAMVTDPSEVAGEIGRFRRLSAIDVERMMAERATTPGSLRPPVVPPTRDPEE